MNIEIADVDPLTLVPEMRELFPAHYEELCVDKRWPYEPDWDVYFLMIAKGMLRAITVRADGELVGYMIFIVRPHLHYRSCLCAFEDLYFLRKDMRQGRLGIKMFKYAEQALKRIGVQKMIVHTKVHMDVSRLLEYLDFKPVDKMYSKDLT